MPSLEAELDRARALDVGMLADAIESIGFECTRCGACCKAAETDDGVEEHTATVFPDEVRRLQTAGSSAGADDGDEAGAETDEAGVETDETGVETDETGVETSDVGAQSAETSEEDDPGAKSGETAGGTADTSEMDYDWRDVARPMPYGLDGGTGETFEWALGTDDCGDCVFYEETDGTGACTVHPDRPLICQTYPFSIGGADGEQHDEGDGLGATEPMGAVVDQEGMVRAHECEGLGRDISREDAEELAATLKERAIRELEEAIGVRDNYERTDADGVVIHDSEGQKRPDGTVIEDAE